MYAKSWVILDLNTRSSSNGVMNVHGTWPCKSVSCCLTGEAGITRELYVVHKVSGLGTENDNTVGLLHYTTVPKLCELETTLQVHMKL